MTYRPYSLWFRCKAPLLLVYLLVIFHVLFHMPHCSVKWCGKHGKTSSYAKDGITFHKFPENPDIKKTWITATHRENFVPTKHSVICSRHFTSDCFESLKSNRRRVFRSAVPTQFLPYLAGATGSEPPEILDSDSDEPDELSRCEGCQGKIKGCVLVCVQCANSKWCSACADFGLHPLHYLVRVPKRRPQNEISEVLKKVWTILKEKNSSEVESERDSESSEDDDEEISNEKETTPNVQVKQEPEDSVPDTEEMMEVVKSEVREEDPLTRNDLEIEYDPRLVLKIEMEPDHTPTTNANISVPDSSTLKQSSLYASKIHPTTFRKSELDSKQCDSSNSKKIFLPSKYSQFGIQKKLGMKRPAEEMGSYHVYTHKKTNRKKPLS